MRKTLQGMKRLVVKVGSNVVTDQDGEFLDRELKSLVMDIAELRAKGIQVVLVSSGAVNIGKRFVDPKVAKKDKIAGQQAASSVGQPLLMSKYRELFQARGLVCSQVLLTHDDFKSRHRFLNARRTMEALLSSGIVPIINENDAISFTEITVGDNDHLAAKVCALIEADTLQLITSSKGLFDQDPSNKDAKLISEVPYGHSLNVEFGALSSSGRGGMQSKVEAVKRALEFSVRALISSKDLERPIIDALTNDNEGTFFWPSPMSQIARNKLWLASIKLSEGNVEVDSGAASAIKAKKSLLAKGIINVEGEFAVGDCVNITHKGQIIARGVSSFTHQEIGAIKGRHSTEISELLGPGRGKVVIHVEQMVLEEA